MNRRAFLGGMVATAAGILIPDRKVWALDKTMVRPELIRTNNRVVMLDGDIFWPALEGTVLRHKGEVMWVGREGYVHREQARTAYSGALDLSSIEVVGFASPEWLRD